MESIPKMEKYNKKWLFDYFRQNNIHFYDYEITGQSSYHQMSKCFDILYGVPDTIYLFYRLKMNCIELGYNDKRDLLIKPTSDKTMVALAQLDHNIDSQTWIEEDEFIQHLENNTLLELISDMLSIVEINDSSSE